MNALVNYDMIFLDKSWEWLNDPEIKALTMTPDFTRIGQVKFFKHLPERKDYWIRGIINNGEPIGAMGLKHITNDTAEYWGYIGEKKYWGKGIGAFMMSEAVSRAKTLGLKELYLFVNDQNTRARKLYLNQGFKLSEGGEIEKYIFRL